MIKSEHDSSEENSYTIVTISWRLEWNQNYGADIVRTLVCLEDKQGMKLIDVSVC